jgi:carbamoyl-phosphate synthase large subunit
VSNNTRILVLPGANEVGLEIWRSLRFAKSLALICGTSVDDTPAEAVYDDVVQIPDLRDDGGVSQLADACRDWGVDMIYPAHDAVVDVLSAAAGQLPCPVVLPGRRVVSVARSKSATYRTLRDVVPVPRVFAAQAGWPGCSVVVKPDAGFGAQGVTVVTDSAAWQSALARAPEPVVTELLPGPEYTVDCFSDRHGELRFAGVRERGRIRMGTALSSRPAPPEIDTELSEWAGRIQRALPFRGAWFFQAKESVDGQPRLLDLGVRPAGSSAIARARGINLALLTVLDRQGIDIDIWDHGVRGNDWRAERMLTTWFMPDPYPECVYVDLDDTLLIRGKVNSGLVAFLYDCRNSGAELVLITKSLEDDLEGHLRQHRLRELFDRVVHLPEAASKSAAVTAGARALFIDDSFTQRQEVARERGIPVMDPSMFGAPWQA